MRIARIATSITTALAVLAGLASGASAGEAASWPCFRGPDRNGISPEAGALGAAKQAKQAWKAQVGTGFSSIAVVAGRVYTMGNHDDTDTVWSLDAADGKTVWKHSYPCKLDPNLYEGGPNATPTVAGGRVYTLSKDGHAFCLDAEKGTVLWQKQLADEVGAARPKWGFSGSPLVHGKLVIYNLGTAGTALDAASGKVAWKSGGDVAGYSSPVPFAANGATLVAMMIKDQAIALDPAGGQVAWRHPWKTSYDVNAADPIVVGKGLFISSGYNHGCALLDISGPKPQAVWESKVMRNQMYGGVALDRHVFGFDDKDSFKCVSLGDGAERWKQAGLGQGSVIAADGKLVILGGKGELVIAQGTSEGFKPLVRQQILGGKCWTAPALLSGRVYARNAVGDLVCVAIE